MIKPIKIFTMTQRVKVFVEKGQSKYYKNNKTIDLFVNILTKRVNDIIFLDDTDNYLDKVLSIHITNYVSLGAMLP